MIFKGFYEFSYLELWCYRFVVVRSRVIGCILVRSLRAGELGNEGVNFLGFVLSFKLLARCFIATSKDRAIFNQVACANVCIIWKKLLKLLILSRRITYLLDKDLDLGLRALIPSAAKRFGLANTGAREHEHHGKTWNNYAKLRLTWL